MAALFFVLRSIQHLFGFSAPGRLVRLVKSDRRLALLCPDWYFLSTEKYEERIAYVHMWHAVEDTYIMSGVKCCHWYHRQRIWCEGGKNTSLSRACRRRSCGRRYRSAPARLCGGPPPSPRAARPGTRVALNAPARELFQREPHVVERILVQFMVS